MSTERPRYCSGMSLSRWEEGTLGGFNIAQWKFIAKGCREGYVAGMILDDDGAVIEKDFEA